MIQKDLEFIYDVTNLVYPHETRWHCEHAAWLLYGHFYSKLQIHANNIHTACYHPEAAFYIDPVLNLFISGLHWTVDNPLDLTSLKIYPIVPSLPSRTNYISRYYSISAKIRA